MKFPTSCLHLDFNEFYSRRKHHNGEKIQEKNSHHVVFPLIITNLAKNLLKNHQN
jgi:hypothetical protein